MSKQNHDLDALIQRVDAAIAEHSELLNAIATQLADLDKADSTPRVTHLEHAANELAILVNQAVVRLTETDNHHAAQVTYLQQKISEHATQLSELFGATPSKITDRLTGIEGSIIELRRVLDTHDERLDGHDARFCRPKAGDEADLEQRVDTIEKALTKWGDDLDEPITERLDELERSLRDHLQNQAAHGL